MLPRRPPIATALRPVNLVTPAAMKARSQRRASSGQRLWRRDGFVKHRAECSVPWTPPELPKSVKSYEDAIKIVLGAKPTDYRRR